MRKARKFLFLLGLNSAVLLSLVPVTVCADDLNNYGNQSTNGTDRTIARGYNDHFWGKPCRVRRLWQLHRQSQLRLRKLRQNHKPQKRQWRKIHRLKPGPSIAFTTRDCVFISIPRMPMNTMCLVGVAGGKRALLGRHPYLKVKRSTIFFILVYESISTPRIPMNTRS